VAMQSTGVYWIPCLTFGSRRVGSLLVNPRQTRNLPGRKSDVQECQWLLKLHTHGLLQTRFTRLRRYGACALYGGSGPIMCVLQALHPTHAKGSDPDESSVSNVISDVAGLTGMAIIRAIVKGERDPHRLAALSHPRIEASRDQIAASLHGNWREDLAFVPSKSWPCMTPTSYVSENVTANWKRN